MASTHKLCSSECRLAYRTLYRPKQKKASKEQRRKWYLKSEYGLKEGEWDSLFALQKHRCAICLTTEPGNRWGWATDHDHETGKVRGILCHSCNDMVGGYDRVIRNPRAIEYVKK